jgi:hypothetical protein
MIGELAFAGEKLLFCIIKELASVEFLTILTISQCSISPSNREGRALVLFDRGNWHLQGKKSFQLWEYLPDFPWQMDDRALTV